MDRWRMCAQRTERNYDCMASRKILLLVSVDLLQSYALSFSFSAAMKSFENCSACDA